MSYYSLISMMPKSATIVIDPDAQAFITAANITNPTQQSAINTLVVSLKAQSLWTKMRAIYPFVGGTATNHKYNLKDPRDLDVAFRLAFTGAWIHSSNGIQGNSFGCYVNTFLNPAATFGALTYSGHFSAYSRTSVPSIPEGLLYWDIGFVDGLVSEEYFGNYIGDYGFGPGVTELASQGQGGYASIGVNLTNIGLNTEGLFTLSRVNQNLLVLYRNSTSLGSSTDSTEGWSNNITVIGQDNAVSSTRKKQFSFATIGTGLTSTDTLNLYTAVQTFQTTLGRQV